MSGRKWVALVVMLTNILHSRLTFRLRMADYNPQSQSGRLEIVL